MSVASFALATPGFVQARDFAIRDGHGRHVDASRTRSYDSEQARVVVDLPRSSTRGQRYRFDLELNLWPTSGLVLEDDVYVLRLPPMARLGPGARRLMLPTRVHVDSCEPKPALSFMEHGQRVLIWHNGQSAKQPCPPESTILVRFRRDGLLTPRWPDRQRVGAFARALFAAIRASDSDRLRTLLHRDFLMRPSGLRAAQLLSTDERVSADRFDRLRIRDITAIGSKISVRLTADWTVEGRNEGSSTERDATFYLDLERRGDALKALRLRPASMSDTGDLRADAYVHEELGFSANVRAAGSSLSQAHDLRCPLQLRISRRGNPGARVEITGYFDREGRERAAHRMRLSGAAIALRPGIRLDDRSSLAHATWSFGTDGSSLWSHERWTWLSKGRRHFLIREISEARSASAAQEHHRKAADWFSLVRQGLKWR